MTDERNPAERELSHPYAPPTAEVTTPSTRRRFPSAAASVITASIVFTVAIGLFIRRPPVEPSIPAALGVGFATALTAAAALRCLVELVVRFRRGQLRLAAGFILVAATGTQIFLFLLGFLAATVAATGFQRGRQLRHNGRVLLPPVARRAWSSTRVESISAELTPTQRATLARRWIENARTEHASVAAFARLTLDLMTLGAPAKLLVDAQKDALDEVRHAELCFALARSFDGNEVGPAPFSEISSASELPSSRVRALSHLAVDSLVDGALLEGMSARVVARLARSVTEPSVRDVLLEIARDEGRHAAHGWDVVLFCLEEGGAPVLDALRGALAGLPADARTTPHEGSDGSLESFGIPGRALESEEYRRTLADLRRRVSALSSSARAAA